ncbi:9137_t:CDS:1, partial [Ambispora leptoticha]
QSIITTINKRKTGISDPNDPAKETDTRSEKSQKYVIKIEFPMSFRLT